MMREILWFFLCMFCFSGTSPAQSGWNEESEGTSGLASPWTASTGREFTSLVTLFAPPTSAEIETVRLDWARRDPCVQGWSVEAQGAIPGGFFAQVVSHRLAGKRHYGLIRYPRNFMPGGDYPVLVFNHGGIRGTNLGELETFDNFFLPGTYLEYNFIYVMPSYRGEELDAGPLGVYLSEGELSVMDWDVDDAMAFLDGVVVNIPEANPQRVAVYGQSRGGCVSLLMAERDPRVQLLVQLSCPTCWTLASIRKKAEELVNSGGPPGGILLDLIMKYGVEPWLDGKIGFEEARLNMIRRSPIYFSENLPALQFHHGTDDTTVPVEHSDRMESMLLELGPHAPPFEYYRYPGGTHDPMTLTGCGQRVEAFLSNVDV
jgi:dipeptidyl aminopeptidase/acylaminoacyl peptidase